MSNWRPTISTKNIQLRAQLLSDARYFFQERNIVEVETPLLGSHTVTDPNIESFTLSHSGTTKYLQTSPEYAMKRLLASGSPDIYQICKSFRYAESGAIHNPEFTLVEWYRLGFSFDQIIEETIKFLQTLLAKDLLVERLTYDDVFKKHLGFILDDFSESEIRGFAINNGLLDRGKLMFEECVDYIFSHCVLPKMSSQHLTVVTDYPASQAALAKLSPGNNKVAERFEVFFQNVELANGYHELTDCAEQNKRFQKDNHQRETNEKMRIDPDLRLLEAMKFGLPDCSGVAVGFDRIMMLRVGASSISEVLSFDWNSA